MYIFKEEKGNIKTYLLYPNIKKVREFKKEEIEKIPHEYTILKALGNVNVLDGEPSYLNWNNLLDSCGDSRVGKVFHMLRKYDFTTEENKRQEKLLTDYYSGSFDDRRVIRVKPYGEDKKEIYGIPKNVEYLLLTRKYEESVYSFLMNDIIVLTKPLYLYETFLRAINNYDYKSVADIDIDKILPYFDICEGTYKPFAKDRIRDMFDARLMNLVSLGAYYPEFMKNMDQSSMIVEKALKLSNKMF